MKRYRKYGYLAILAAAALTACQAKGTLAPEAGEMQEEEHMPVSGEAADETGTGPETSESGQETSESGQEKTESGQKPAPIFVELGTDYDGTWEDNHARMRVENDSVHVLNEGYEALKAALKEYNEYNWNEAKDIFTESAELLEEGAFSAETEWYLERKIEIQRSDEKILSFWNTEESYLGGAHGILYGSGENFDPGTGNRLELSDVTADYDKVYEYAKNYLAENYEQDMFFPDYAENILEPMFYKASDGGIVPLEWTMNQEELTLLFNPYALAPWAAGSITVKIPFAGNEELIKKEYLYDGAVTARKVRPGKPFCLDLDGDGKEESLLLSETASEEQYTTSIELSGNDGQGSSEFYGSFSDAYVMLSQSGHPYLYVEFLSDNDMRSLEIFDLEKWKDDGILKSAGGLGNAIYEHFVPGAEGFVLFNREDLLGTYMVFREYYMGEDGIPVPKEEEYTVTEYMLGEGYTITSTRELAVEVDGKEEIMPAGTTFLLAKTGGFVENGETFVEAELPDQRRCRIYITRTEDDYCYYIDGVNEYDCFESLRYAG